jgi:hypothetical protein
MDGGDFSGHCIVFGGSRSLLSTHLKGAIMIDTNQGPYYRLVNGVPVPCSFLEYLRSAPVIIAKWNGDGGITVKTDFLGMDSSGSNPPRVWLTAISGGPYHLNRQHQQYATKEEAVRGHRAAIKRARRAMVRGFVFPR